MSARPSSLIVIGASAGGIEPLKVIVSGLPPDLAAAVAIVLHVSPTGESHLPAILNRAGRLPVVHARDGEQLGEGRVYVAPPDRHLLVVDGRCSVVREPRENNAGPAVDPLFRSAAAAYGSRVVAVVLSGTLADGVAGAAFVSSVGGTVIVQDPEEADFSAMPANAIARDHPDCVLELAAIPEAMSRLWLVFRSRTGRARMSERQWTSKRATPRWTGLRPRTAIRRAGRRGSPARDAAGCSRRSTTASCASAAASATRTGEMPRSTGSTKPSRRRSGRRSGPCSSARSSPNVSPRGRGSAAGLGRSAISRTPLGRHSGRRS